MFHLTFQNDLLLSSCAKQAYLSRIFRFSPCERHLQLNLHESNVPVCYICQKSLPYKN